MELCLIAAVAENLAIGRDGTMPWHIAEDLKFFKRTTMSCPVIMGRKTFNSIGKPLPGRRNVVLSRSAASIEGVEVVPSLEKALELLKDEPKVFVIGGASVYSASISLADTLYITHLHTDVADADTFFPAIDTATWTVCEHSEQQIDTSSGIAFEFVTWRRTRK